MSADGRGEGSEGGDGGAPGALALWPLPLLAGVVPAVAAIAALAISVQLDLVVACNPFVDGCVSISRAARQGPATPLFRALVLPAAVLQALTWIVAARWLRSMPAARGTRGLGALATLGITAAVALVAYSTVLGIDGGAWRQLRHAGTVIYFGFTCVNLLIAGGAIQRAADAGQLALPRHAGRAIEGLAVVLVALGLANALVGAVVDGEIVDRVQNVAEWWGAAIFVVGFVALAAVWRRCRLRLSLLADPR